MQRSLDSRFFTLFSFVVLMALPAVFINAHLPHPEANSYQKHKAAVVEEIYNKIARTVKDTRKAPTLNFIYNDGRPYYNAYYNPQNNTINFGEGIYDLALKFGPDSINALAMVIGHELAHFYKDHGWGMSFGTANEDTEIAQKIYDMEMSSDVRAKMEAEADYYGALFGFLAGYNTLKVGGAFFDSLYVAAAIPDSTFGYPSRRDRVGICNNSKKALRELIPVFKAANMLTITSDFETASICYDHILSIFPGREVYNNAGVTSLANALGTYKEDELKYLFPLGLDIDTRLDAVAKGFDANDDQPAGTWNSKDDALNPKRQRWLKSAKEHFEDAIRIDEDYAPAYANLAIAQGLLGDKELALANAAKGIKKALAQGQLLQAANAQIIRGILQALAGNKSEAKKEFTEAKTHNGPLAAVNLETLNSGKIAQLFKKKPKEEIASLEETINDMGIEVMEVLFDNKEKLDVTLIEKQNDDRPETIIVSTKELEFDAMLVATYEGKFGDEEHIRGFLMTKPDYTGETALNIKIGSSLKEVKTAYGSPTRVNAGSSVNFLLYDKSNLVFMTDDKDIVIGWVLYGKLK